MKKVLYNPLNGEISLEELQNEYTFKINDETFSIPFGMTWEQWCYSKGPKINTDTPRFQITQVGSSAFAVFDRSNSRIVQSFVIPNQYNVAAINGVPIDFIDRNKFPIANKQYVSHQFFGSQELAFSTKNLGAITDRDNGLLFLDGIPDPNTTSTGGQKFNQGDFGFDPARTWFYNTGSNISTPTAEQWQALLNSSTISMGSNGATLTYYGQYIFLPYGIYGIISTGVFYRDK